MLATRDKNGDLYIFDTNDKEDLYKDLEYNKWFTYLSEGEYMKIPPELCPNVKWEDKKPTKVKITIKELWKKK